MGLALAAQRGIIEGMRDDTVEQFYDVLQNIEFAILSVYENEADYISQFFGEVRRATPSLRRDRS